MDEQKRPVDEHEEPEEEYSFLQEVIKDEADSGKKLKKSILRMTGLGLVFGIVACFTFSALKPWMEEQFSNEPEQITIPEDDEEEPDGEQTEEEKPVPDEQSYQEMLQTLAKVAEENSKSVVEIQGEEPWNMAGVIIADNGQELLILGKKAPDRMSGELKITFADDEQYDATVKQKDGNLDMAVYAVSKDVIADSTWAKIETATLGSSNIVMPGDTVIVLGRTYGNDNRMSYGLLEGDKSYAEYADGQYGVLHTDIIGTEEESGVILNMDGEVIGIVSPSLTKEAVDMHIAGFAVSDIKNVIELLSNGVGVPYTGMRAVDLTEDMQEQGFPKGISVKEVEADSPAMAAGIQSGDIITEVDGVEVGTYAMYHNTLMKKGIGSKIELKGCRQGAGGEYVDIDFTVTVGTRD